MLKAVIFDVDGTLLDTERIYMRAWKEAGKLHGYDVTDEVLLKTRAVNTVEAAGIFESEIGNGFSYSKCRVDRVRISEEIISREKELRKPGVEELLKYLKEKGILMAVASSTDIKMTREHLAFAGIGDAFSVMVGGDMVERGKPAPDIFLKAAELLGVEAEECMVIEDSPAGIQAACKAGMRAVMVPDCVAPAGEIRQMAYAVAESLREVPALVGELL